MRPWRTMNKRAGRTKRTPSREDWVEKAVDRHLRRLNVQEFLKRYPEIVQSNSFRDALIEDMQRTRFLPKRAFVMRPPRGYGLPIGVILGGVHSNVATEAHPNGTFSHTFVPSEWKVNVEKRWAVLAMDESAEVPDEVWEKVECANEEPES